VCRTLANFRDVGVDRGSRTVTRSMPSLMRTVALYILDRGCTSREGSCPSLSLCSFISAVFPNLPAVAPFRRPVNGMCHDSSCEEATDSWILSLYKESSTHFRKCIKNTHFFIFFKPTPFTIFFLSTFHSLSPHYFIIIIFWVLFWYYSF